jgi:hypothetical protein
LRRTQVTANEQLAKKFRSRVLDELRGARVRRLVFADHALGDVGAANRGSSDVEERLQTRKLLGPKQNPLEAVHIRFADGSTMGRAERSVRGRVDDYIDRPKRFARGKLRIQARIPNIRLDAGDLLGIESISMQIEYGANAIGWALAALRAHEAVNRVDVGSLRKVDEEFASEKAGGAGQENVHAAVQSIT